MFDSTQFGARKNPALHSRPHGLRPAVDSNQDNTSTWSNDHQNCQSLTANSLNDELQPSSHATPHHAATGEETPNPNRLLTVREVADLLQVPVSWVYGRLRKRSLERLPGYRLGKYWRFDEADVLVWLKSQHTGRHAA